MEWTNNSSASTSFYLIRCDTTNWPLLPKPMANENTASISHNGNWYESHNRSIGIHHSKQWDCVRAKEGERTRAKRRRRQEKNKIERFWMGIVYSIDKIRRKTSWKWLTTCSEFPFQKNPTQTNKQKKSDAEIPFSFITYVWVWLCTPYRKVYILDDFIVLAWKSS